MNEILEVDVLKLNLLNSNNKAYHLHHYSGTKHDIEMVIRAYKYGGKFIWL